MRLGETGMPTPDDINKMVELSVQENDTLDFKQEISRSVDKDKKEQEKYDIRFDATAMANTDGGLILYGIVESDGAAASIKNIEGSIDEAVRRIEEIISTKLEPPLKGFRCEPIVMSDKCTIIALRIPKSWNAPHFVDLGNQSYRVYKRGSRQNLPIGPLRIRELFHEHDGVVNRLRAWRDERLARIHLGEIPLPLVPTAKLVLHFSPLDALANPYRASASELSSLIPTEQQSSMSGWFPRTNLDGLVRYSTDGGAEPASDPRSAYCQAFRSGAVELISAKLIDTRKNPPTIYSQWHEKFVIDSVVQFRTNATRLGASAPFIVWLTLLDAKGITMALDPLWCGNDPHTIDRDTIMLPEVVLDDEHRDVPRALLPAFDALWNACGFNGSPNFDERGNWKHVKLPDAAEHENRQ